MKSSISLLIVSLITVTSSAFAQSYRDWDSRVFIDVAFPTFRPNLSDLGKKTDFTLETQGLLGNAHKVNIGWYFINGKKNKTTRLAFGLFRWKQDITQSPHETISFYQLGFDWDRYHQIGPLATFFGSGINFVFSVLGLSTHTFSDLAEALTFRVGAEIDIIRNRLFLRGEAGYILNLWTMDYIVTECTSGIISTSGGACYSRRIVADPEIKGQFNGPFLGFSIGIIFR